MSDIGNYNSIFSQPKPIPANQGQKNKAEELQMAIEFLKNPQRMTFLHKIMSHYNGQTELNTNSTYLTARMTKIADTIDRFAHVFDKINWSDENEYG